MDFTPLYPHSSSSSSKASSNGRYVLTAVGERLIVRSTTTMEIIRSWKCQQPDNLKPSLMNTGKQQALKLHEGKSQTLTTKSNRTASGNLRDSDAAVLSLRHPTSLPASTENQQLSLTCVSFSSNSQHVVALLRQATSTVVFVYSISSEEPVAHIKVGAEGVAAGEKAVTWSPSGESLMIWSDWGLRVTIWSLTSTQSKPVQLHSPKHGPSIGSDFSPTGRYFALLCRLPGSTHDHVGIYDTVTWACVSFFELSSGLMDSTHLSWSPCGRYLAIVESALFDYRVEIWSPTGLRLAVHAPYHDHPDGVSSLKDEGHLPKVSNQLGDRNHINSMKKDFSKLGDLSKELKAGEVPDGYIGLGIRNIKWRCGGEYLAIGGWDGKVRILNDLTWTPMCEIDLIEYPSGRVLSEPRDWIQRTCGQGIIPFEATSVKNLTAPLRPDFNKPNPTIGIRDIRWSHDGEYMACRNDSMPHTIFIFSFKAVTHMQTPSTDSKTTSTAPSVPLRPRMTSILHFVAPVRSMMWSPLATHLAAVCATSALYIWYPTQPGVQNLNNTEQVDYLEGIGIPARVPFAPVTASWTQGGGSILAADRNAFCLAFPIPEDHEGHRRDESMIMDL
ncbi:WD40-repeat-containing domain protein [Phakopsora pachyrhizi]|uniref:WD40-repeat-containing domain protein n=1 Tax=Phakopsora pachyrhizi TaxID=170000 RepID=A0AAV0B0L4_PHAPC|nr:WD40-repeat-containing domain protein [Phakopsora pachyrhizi]